MQLAQTPASLPCAARLLCAAVTASSLALSNVDATADGASFTFSHVEGATSYRITVFKDGGSTALSTVTRNAASQPPAGGYSTEFTLSGSDAYALGGEPGAFEFRVVALADGVESDPVSTGSLIVGRPGAPAWATAAPVVASVGTSTLRWTAPSYNAHVGTTYKLQLWSSDGTSRVGSTIALTASGDGSDAAPFTALADLEAAKIDPGTYQYELVPANKYGGSTPSDKTAAVRSRERCPWEWGAAWARPGLG